MVHLNHERPYYHRWSSAMLALLFPVLAFGQVSQEWKFFGPEDGMGMAFHKIHQDHYGFLWCASSNGLYRYDGYEFKAFKKYVTHSNPIESDFIWDILEDHQHNIWLATYDGGINKWVRKTASFIYYNHEPGNTGSLASDKVLQMMVSRQGRLWAIVETEDGFPVLDCLDPLTGEVKHYRHRKDDPLTLDSDIISVVASAGSPLRPLIQDEGGRIWVATRRGLNRYIPEKDGFQSVPGPWLSREEQVIHLYESPAVPGLIWILAATDGLASGHVYRLDARTMQAKTLDFPLDGLLTYAPTGIYQAPGRPDELWLSSRELCQINLKEQTSETHTPEIKPDPSLWQGLRDSLFLIYPASSGTPWLAPMGFPPNGHNRGSENYYIRSGLFRLSSENGRLERWSQNPTDTTQSFGMVYSISDSHNGNTWISCFPGFYQYREERPGQRFFPVFQDIRLWERPAERANLSAWAAVERPGGILWVATFKGGLKRVNIKSGKVIHFRNRPGIPSSIAHDKVYALFADETSGRLWIGTESGLDWVELAELDGPQPRPTFHHLKPDEPLAQQPITSISPGPEGLLWIGTQEEGILLFDPVRQWVTSQYKAGSPPHSLNSSYINTVFTDSRGRGWVATGMGGLCQILPGKNGGENEFNCHLEGMYIVDIFENNDGKLWLAAMNYGIAIFDPETGDYELWNMENHLKRNSVLGIERDSQ
ncbi:MAG: hypothetical protein KDD06_17035, partial [Phaeodactylibacter sp.]|nr:hypothetical protein [Phaeodactylibacter sp.]